MDRDNSRLRRLLTQFLNRHRNDDNRDSYRYLNEQMAQVDEQLKSINEDMSEKFDDYYKALSEGNVEEAQQLQNQIRDMKEQKKRYKQTKKQIKENIDEIKDLQDIVEEQSEETRNKFSDAFDDMGNILQTLNIMDIKDKIGDSVDNINDAIREAANSLGWTSEEKNAFNQAIYDNTNAINEAAGKNILSVNDAADDIASLIDAGMTNQDTLSELAPLLAEGNKLLGLESDSIADLAVKFQDSPDVIKNLYNMMASGKLNLSDDYKDYALKGYEKYAEQSNDMAQVLKNYQDKGLDVNDINAQLLAINSTLEKNSLGDMDIAQIVNDASSMNQSEFADAYGATAVRFQNSIKNGDMSGLEKYVENAINAIRNGTPEEQWNETYGGSGFLDYQALKNSNASTQQVGQDYQTYLDTYRQGLNNDDVMTQVAQNYSMSPLEEFWNYFSGLPIIQKISTFMGDLNLSVSDIAVIGYSITGILKNFPGLLKGITKPLSWLGRLFTGGSEGGGLLAGLGSLFSGLGTKISSLFSGAGSGSGLLSTIGGAVSKVAPWLAVGSSAVQGASGLYQGITSDNQSDKARGYTSAGMNLGGMGLGAAIGTFLFPGVGTLAGAGIGSAVGSIGDWLFGDKISSLFGGDDKSKDTTTQNNTTNNTENNTTTPDTNTYDNNTDTILNNIYSTLTEWYNSYNGGTTNNNAQNSSAIVTQGGVNATNSNYTTQSSYSGVRANTLSNSLQNTYSNNQVENNLQNASNSIKNGLSESQMQSSYNDSTYQAIQNGTTNATQGSNAFYTATGSTDNISANNMADMQDVDLTSTLYSDANTNNTSFNENPIRNIQDNTTQTNEYEYNNQGILANIYSTVLDWFNTYTNKSRVKAETLSNYPVFNTGETLTTSNTSSSAYSSGTPESISSGEDYNNYMSNTNTEKGSLTDSGSNVAPGFEGTHKNGLDYVPHDNYAALLHKGEAVLTAQENTQWQSMKKNPLVVDGSHREGLDYVPYDGYIAELHKGESVLTAQENKVLQSMGGDINYVTENRQVNPITNTQSRNSSIGGSYYPQTNNSINEDTFSKVLLNSSSINNKRSLSQNESINNDNINTENIYPKIDGSHKTGLSVVPTATYIAQLHKGEGVLASANSIPSVSSVVNSTTKNKLLNVKNNKSNKKSTSKKKTSNSSKILETMKNVVNSTTNNKLNQARESILAKNNTKNKTNNKSTYDNSNNTDSTNNVTNNNTNTNKKVYVKKKSKYPMTTFYSSPIETVREKNFLNSMSLMDALTSKEIVSQAAASMTDFESAIKQASAPATTSTDGTTGSTDDTNLATGTGDDFLGRYGCAFESGGSSTSAVNPGLVSTTKGDTGGTSYGIYQMATNGEAPAFGRWLTKNFPNDMGKLFQGQTAGTSGFNNAWKKAYQQYGDKFKAAQVKFFARDGSDYQNWVKGVKRTSGLNLEENRGYQEMACSLAAHNGTGGESRWNKLVGQWYKQGKTGTSLVDAVCDARITQWVNGSNTSKYGRKPAENRWGANSDERKTLKQLISKPAIAYAQGTPWVPNDQVALLHKGEMVVPKANNPLASNTTTINNNTNNNNETIQQKISDKETLKELRQIASVIQQGITFLGKKMDNQESKTQEVTVSNAKESSLYNLKDVYKKNQL